MEPAARERQRLDLIACVPFNIMVSNVRFTFEVHAKISRAKMEALAEMDIIMEMIIAVIARMNIMATIAPANMRAKIRAFEINVKMVRRVVASANINTIVHVHEAMMANIVRSHFHNMFKSIQKKKSIYLSTKTISNLDLNFFNNK